MLTLTLKEDNLNLNLRVSSTNVFQKFDYLCLFNEKKVKNNVPGIFHRVKHKEKTHAPHHERQALRQEVVSTKISTDTLGTTNCLQRSKKNEIQIKNKHKPG